MKEKGYRRIFHVLWQMDIIMALFVWLFQIARYSHYYTMWDEQVHALIGKANIINGVVMAFLLAGSVFFAVKVYNKNYFKAILPSFICILILFGVQLAIRIPMLGSYQISDGQTYFTELTEILEEPNDVLFDFLHKGVIAGGHIAHGYIFTTMLGQLLNVSSGMGFQYSQMIMGAVAACFLYGIFRKLLEKSPRYVCVIAALIVSIQPMFLGLSTLAQMEYNLVIFFIYVIFSYIYKQYILMAFWLLVLGTCKETGTMMAFSLLAFVVLYTVIDYIRKKKGIRAAVKGLSVPQRILIILFILVCITGFIIVLNMPMWRNYRIIDVLKFGGEGNMNFQFKPAHFLLKLRQLYILNFSWLWAGILVIGLILNYAVPAFRKRKAVNGRLLSFLIIQYVIYFLFLTLFLEAKVTRYNMLSDVLFLLFAVTIVAKLANRIFTFLPITALIGGLAFAEVFLTIDPVTRAVFTPVQTGGIPMVWTAATPDEIESININIGDFGYYNYQYTFIDRAVDIMLDEVDYQDWYRIISTFQEGTEDQVGNPALMWDSEKRTRTYYDSGEEGRFHRVIRLACDKEVYIEAEKRDHRLILFESPWCNNNRDFAIDNLSEFYVFEGPFTVSVGLAGSITYFILYLK